MGIDPADIVADGQEPHSISRDHIGYDIICNVRLVLDTDVIVAAMRSPKGASAAILTAVRRDRVIQLLMTIPLALEYEATCSRAEHRLAAGLSERGVNVFLDAIMAMAEPVKTHFLWRPQLRDPGDEMVLEAAVNGRADALVTFNLRHFEVAAAAFGLEVLLPREVIRRIRE